MKQQDYTVSILVSKDAATVYNAITNFRGWWSEEIEGNTNQLNESFFYHYRDIHLCKIKLIEAVPNKKLLYHVLDNHFSFVEDKTEWINTKLVFEIEAEGEKIKITLTHEGLNSMHECYQICNESWDNYIKKSLFNFIELGKGSPNPKEGDGFNAEVVKKWKLKG